MCVGHGLVINLCGKVMANEVQNQVFLGFRAIMQYL